MIDTRTGQPVDPNWRPMLAIDELEPANQRMAGNPRCHFSFQWVPITQPLSGTVILATDA